MKQLRLAPLAAFAFAVSVMPAHAQSAGGGGSITTFISNISNLITGTLGTALAILAVAFLGLTMLFGTFDRRHGFTMVIGIIVLFSAAWVVGQITGNSTGTSGF